jgi:prevent-host-death family protein
MTTISIEQGGSQLADLVEQARAGEEVILTQESKPVARLMPIEPKRRGPKRGSDPGLIRYMADDFDAPLEEFAEYS